MDTTVADPLVGQVLDGRYRVESRVARGGMATVYLSRDVKLDRVIALKVMHPHLAQDADFVRRFIGEAKSAAALSHPNVVAVYDQGTDGQHVYLAMEYVPGRTLRDLLAEEGRLAPQRALELMQPVLAALGAAHRAGLVHRDVKPENVLLTDEGQIKVADFGLARAETDSGQTKTGLIIGTVAYLAPEQVVSGHADVRSDVYAAGIMLFELLTGRQPHQGESPLAVAYKHVNEVVPPPSSLVPGIPRQLDLLVAAATAHDAARRPPDADRFLASVVAAATNLAQGIDPAAGIPGADNATSMLYAAPSPTMPGSRMPGGPMAGGPMGGNHTSVLPPGALAAHDAARPMSRMDRLIEWATGRYVLVALGTVAAVVIGWAVWYQTAGQYESIPDDIIGMQVTSAERQLRDAGLEVKLAKAVYSDKIPEDRVVAVNPKPGTDVQPGDVVRLTPSRGPRPIEVPDVRGKTEDEARTILEGAGFTAGSTTSDFSKSVPKGQVMGTDPDIGEKAQPGDTITIVLSKGLQMPNVIGQPKDQATSALQSYGLQVEVVTRQQDGAQPNTVLAQDPQPGTAVSSGDRVKLEVSPDNCLIFGFICEDGDRGRGNDGQENVPTTVGRRLDDAVRRLQEKGFQVNVQHQLNSGRVVSQNPFGGRAPRGTVITIVD